MASLLTTVRSSPLALVQSRRTQCYRSLSEHRDSVAAWVLRLQENFAQLQTAVESDPDNRPLPEIGSMWDTLLAAWLEVDRLRHAVWASFCVPRSSAGEEPPVVGLKRELAEAVEGLRATVRMLCDVLEKPAPATGSTSGSTNPTAQANSVVENCETKGRPDREIAPDNEHELLKMKEVAGLLRRHPEHFRQKYLKGGYAGFPKHIQDGRQRLWWREEVIGWIEAKRKGASNGREGRITVTGEAESTTEEAQGKEGS